MEDVYPKRSHYLIFFREGDETIMKNAITDEMWSIPESVAAFIKCLDGNTDPYCLQCDGFDVEDILTFMEEEELFDDGERLVDIDAGNKMLGLWFPDIDERHREAGSIWNQALIILWPIVLTFGLWIFISDSYYFVDGDLWYSMLGFYGGVVVGIILHELSHVAAALDYGGTVFEIGVMILNFCPGAYCLLDSDNVKNRFKRAQINAAGVECNLLLCGLCLCLLKLQIIPSGLLVCAAESNAVLAFMNLSFTSALDGNKVFEEFLGCPDFNEKARMLVRDRKGKALLRKQGINGYAKILASYISYILQMVFPLLMILVLINTFLTMFS